MSYLKPGRVALLGDWFMRTFRAKPTLTVVGRRSGQPRTLPVNVLEVRRFWKVLPNDEDHPVFEIEPAD